MPGAHSTVATPVSEVGQALADARHRTRAGHARLDPGAAAVLALQRSAGNSAVAALLAARLRSPGDTALADIDAATRELRRDEPAIDTVETGLEAAKATGVPVELEGPKPPASALAVIRTGFGPGSVAPKQPVPPPKPVAPKHPLGKAAATVPRAPVPRARAVPAGAGATTAAATQGPTSLGAGPQLQPPVAPGRTRPDQDPAFTQVTGGVRRAAADERAHPPAASKAKEAQDAALAPADDLGTQAKAAKADTMDAQHPGTFDKQAFITAVKAAIEAKSPKTLTEADDFKASGKAGEVKGEVGGLVTAGTQGQTKDIEAATQAPPDQSKTVAKPVTPLAPEAPGPVPQVAAAGAVPKLAPAEQLNLAAGKQQADDELATADVSESQLARSNEPEFQQALTDKKTAAAHAGTAPGGFRQQEAGVLSQTRTEATAETNAGLGSLQSSKGAALAKLVADKGRTKTKDEAKRAEVTTRIQTIFNATENDVKVILDGIDPAVDAEFTKGEAGARAAFETYVSAKMSAYKKDRYSGWLGGLRWAKDKLVGMPDKVGEFYAAGRELYLQRMNLVISNIADLVGNGLTKAKQRIAAGRTEIASYVKSLPTDLQKVGAEASNEINERFEQLESEVDSKQDAMVESLASKYVESRQGLDDRIEELQAENKGLVDKAIGAIKAVINTIRELVSMLTGVLARAAGVVGDIVKDPIGFLGNLIAGVKGGIMRFKDNVVDHLRKGLMGWLFGALAEGGIEIPSSFDVKGIVKLLASIFGLTWTNIRIRIVKQIGETAMGAVERGVQIFQVISGPEGLGGLWQLMVEKLGDIKETILEQVKTFVVDKIITAGLTWLIGLLNPAAAFIKACKLIYDVVMFFVNNAGRIKTFVDTILDSVGEIVKGNVSGVVTKIDNVLSQMVPLLIGFLASAIGLGGIGAKIREIIQTLQKPVNQALDFVIKQGLKLAGPIVRGLKGVGSKVKARLQGGDDTPAGRQRRLDLAMAAGVAATNRFAGRPVGDRLLRPALSVIRMRYGVATLEPVPQATTWAVHGEVQRVVVPTDAALPAGALPVAGPTGLDPGVPAPGIGRIGSHGSKPSSLREGPEIHHLESEHIIPFAVGKRLWEMVALAMPGRKGHEDRNQTTIMIYKGAADRKTAGDRRLWEGFEAAVGRADVARRLASVRTSLAWGLDSARAEGVELIGQLMQGVHGARNDAVPRTNAAVVADSRFTADGSTRTNAERRGPPGQPEPASPTPGQVTAAADQQFDDVILILEEVLSEVNEGLPARITPDRRRRR